MGHFKFSTSSFKHNTTLNYSRQMLRNDAWSDLLLKLLADELLRNSGSAALLHSNNKQVHSNLTLDHRLSIIDHRTCLMTFAMMPHLHMQPAVKDHNLTASVLEGAFRLFHHHPVPRFHHHFVRLPPVTPTSLTVQFTVMTSSSWQMAGGKRIRLVHQHQ